MQFEPQIPRPQMLQELRLGLEASPITILLGPRQCGKSWLTRSFASSSGNYFDLSSFEDSLRLEETQFRVLDDLDGIVVIDEAQRMPEIFRKLRILADSPGTRARYIVTGSASPAIVRGVSESLAGRARFIEAGGFTADEVGWENFKSLWLKGGLPPAYLHQLPENSFRWRQDYVMTFIERDLPQLTQSRLTSVQIRRLLMLLANTHGRYWKASEASELLGVDIKTVQRHLELFKGAFLIRQLPLYVTNLNKRLRKAPRFYFRDTGILHTLLAVEEWSQLLANPQYGPSWEGFCIEQVIRMTRSHEDQCFTWSLEQGAEVDLILAKPSGVWGIECKAGPAPKKEPSMEAAANLLGLKGLFVIYPGAKSYELTDKIKVVAFSELESCIPTLS